MAAIAAHSDSSRSLVRLFFALLCSPLDLPQLLGPTKPVIIAFPFHRPISHWDGGRSLDIYHLAGLLSSFFIHSFSPSSFNKQTNRMKSGQQFVYLKMLIISLVLQTVTSASWVSHHQTFLWFYSRLIRIDQFHPKHNQMFDNIK